MSRSKPIGCVEALAWALGCVLLAIYGGARAYVAYSSRVALDEFRERQAALIPIEALAPLPQGSVSMKQLPIIDVDNAGGSSVSEPLGAAESDANDEVAHRNDGFGIVATESPSAIVRIPALELEVPVYGDASELNLNRGAGWIQGTAPLDAGGNVGLAAHRDGFFRALAGIALADRIELATLHSTRRYIVTEIRVVTPDAVELLAPTDKSMLTLVTCYPFNFVGPAPERFVVRAELERNRTGA